MTELSPVSHLSAPDKSKPGSCGLLVANTEARIVDPETNSDAALGERGELWIKGPQVMTGYLANDEVRSLSLSLSLSPCNI
jgi:long-subunit acyl-CoA synthetase (AMP-forming)